MAIKNRDLTNLRPQEHVDVSERDNTDGLGALRHLRFQDLGVGVQVRVYPDGLSSGALRHLSFGVWVSVGLRLGMTAVRG